jgi:hypothetical protein
MVTNADIVSFFCRHLIGIGWYEGPVGLTGEFVAEPVFYGASGFLLQPHEDVSTYCLVTAGHVFREHKTRMRMPNMATRQFSLFDVWGTYAKSGERIPFDLFDVPVLEMYDAAAGVDFAVVALPNLIQQLLGQTTIPFTKRNWIHQGDVAYDFFAMLGLPNEEAQQDRFSEGGQNSITTFQNPVLLLLEPGELPSSTERAREPEFVGRIDSRVDLKSIVGMSGGPIFGFRHEPDGRLAYWPVAIQSRWFPDRRIVIASYLAPLAAHLDQWISHCMDQHHRE